MTQCGLWHTTFCITAQICCAEPPQIRLCVFTNVPVLPLADRIMLAFAVLCSCCLVQTCLILCLFFDIPYYNTCLTECIYSVWQSLLEKRVRPCRNLLSTRRWFHVNAIDGDVDRSRFEYRSLTNSFVPPPTNSTADISYYFWCNILYFPLTHMTM